MRVTNQMMANASLANLNRLRQQQATLNEQISSGQRITRPSEDPNAGAEVMRIQNRTNVMTQWEAALNDTKKWVRTTEARLTDITNLINTAKEMALQGANGTLSDTTRKGMAPGADQLLQDVLAALNEQEPDGALFGGFVTDKAPFAIDLTTGVVTYSGDAGNMQRDVGPGVSMTANLHGNRFLDPTSTGWSTDPNNMLTTLWELAQGLKAGDANMVAATMGRLDKAHETVVSLRAEIGARDMRIEQLEQRMADTKVQLEDLLGQAQGVDPVKSIMDLNNAEVTYRAALQVGGRVLPQTLADFLR